MEAGTLLHSSSITAPWISKPRSLPLPLGSRRFKIPCASSSSSSNPHGGYRGPKPRRDLVADWVKNNDGAVRTLPIYVGGASLLAVLLNRAVSGIAPVADASSYGGQAPDSISFSSQSRADLLTLGLAVTNILTGLVWLTIRPKTSIPVNSQGVECQFMCSDLPEFLASELLWVWESLSAAACCKSLVIVYDCRCMLQIGMAAESPINGQAVSVDAVKLMQGSLYQGVKKSGAQSYLANLSLYPGRSELPFLPPNTQAVILQPVGDKGLAILGGDTIRGFSTSDQAWITYIGEKVDASLAKYFSNIPLAVQDRP